MVIVCIRLRIFVFVRLVVLSGCRFLLCILFGCSVRLIENSMMVCLCVFVFVMCGFLKICLIILLCLVSCLKCCVWIDV